MLLLLEDGALREAAEVTEQPWFRLHHLLATARPETDLAAFSARCRVLGASPAGFERQLDAVAALKPAGMSREDWDDVVEDRCGTSDEAEGGRGSGMEPMTMLACNYAFLHNAPMLVYNYSHVLARFRLHATARSGPQWEETLSSWTALHAFAHRCKRQYAPGLSSQEQHSDSGSGAGSGVVPTEEFVAVPPLDEFLLDLFALEGDADAQLDWLARYRPPRMDASEWDRGVSQVRGCSRQGSSNSVSCWLASLWRKAAATPSYTVFC